MPILGIDSSRIPGNVETLSFERVPPRHMQDAPAHQMPAAPVLDIADVQNKLLELHNQSVATLTRTVQDVAHSAVQSALNASNATVLGTFHAIGTILAVRFILLLSLIGAFTLAIIAMESPTIPAIIILVSYVALTVLPLVWLDRNGRRVSQA